MAKPGFITCSSDFGALQEVTTANITHDANKVKILSEGFDSHCFHAQSYYPRIEEILGKNDGSLEWNKNFKNKAKSDPELNSLRTASKAVSFKLLFGGFPDIHKGGSISEEMFDTFHNKLYPGVTSYNKDVVLKQAVEEGEVYLGLGFSILTDNPNKDLRTLANGTAQFWDIITILTMPVLRSRIDKAGLSKDILLTATIYDSIYFEVKEDPVIIKWLNDNLIEIMTKQIFKDQLVPNVANLDIGPSWANQVEIPNNASIEEIQQVLDRVR